MPQGAYSVCKLLEQYARNYIYPDKRMPLVGDVGMYLRPDIGSYFDSYIVFMRTKMRGQSVVSENIIIDSDVRTLEEQAAVDLLIGIVTKDHVAHKAFWYSQLWC